MFFSSFFYPLKYTQFKYFSFFRAIPGSSDEYSLVSSLLLEFDFSYLIMTFPFFTTVVMLFIATK